MAAETAERTAPTRRPFEYAYMALEQWAAEYEALHAEGYPNRSVEGRIIDGEIGSGTPGHRVLQRPAGPDT